MSVETVAQAVYELATNGKLSDQTTEDIHAILGLVVDEETGVVVPEGTESGSEDDLTEDENQKEPEKASGAVKKGTK